MSAAARRAATVIRLPVDDDGNAAFAVLCDVRGILRRAGAPPRALAAFTREAVAARRADRMLRICDRWLAAAEARP